MQTRGNNWYINSLLRLACRSCYLDVMLLQDPALLVQPDAEIQSWYVGKERIEEEEEEVWKRPHKPLFLSERSLCKIAFSFISNCSFSRDKFSKRLPQNLPVSVRHCIILTQAVQTEIFSMWMWGRLPAHRFSWKKKNKKYQKDSSCGNSAPGH